MKSKEKRKNMSLINCPECKKAISNKATACPNCGYPIKSTTTNLQIQQINPQTPSKPKKKGHGCLSTIFIVFFIFLMLGIILNILMIKFPQDASSTNQQSILAKTMDLDSDQEANMLKILEACGIGEVTSVSVFQSGEDQTSYYLEDKEIEVYKGAEYDVVIWVDNTNKTINSIYFHDQDIYLDGKMITPITDYYVNSSDRDKYRVATQLAITELLNYPDTAEFPAISGWVFEIEDDTIIVQSTVTAKNAFNMESTSTFQAKFVSDSITSLIMDDTEYVK